MNQGKCLDCSLLRLDLASYKSKNSELIQIVASLKNEKAQLLNTVKEIRNENVKLNYKMAKSRDQWTQMSSTVSSIFAKLYDATEDVNRLSQQINTKLKDGRTQTQAVTPHAVNGLVLNNPIINIPRLNDRASQRFSDSAGMPGPSSRLDMQEQENLVNIQVTRGSSKPFSVNIMQERNDNSYNDEFEDEEDNIEDTGDDSVNEAEHDKQTLSTIQEESERASFSSGERQIMIYIPLPNDNVNHKRHTTTKEHSSTSAASIPNVSGESSNPILQISKSNSSKTLNSAVDTRNEESYHNFFKSLQLTPRRVGDISTPIAQNTPRMQIALDTQSNTPTPTYNFVNTRRGCNGASKVLKVIIERMNMENMVSPAKNKSTAKRKRRTIDKPNKPSTAKMFKKSVKNSVENIRSPRLKRKARPAVPLKEPRLNSKLRQN